MGAETLSAVCEGQVEKKVEHRRLPIMPSWKRKYGVLDSEALRLYRSKTKMNNGDLALRTIPLCHIKSVSKVYEDEPAQTICFNLFTEQGEVLSFRSRNDVGWVAQIQIQLIHYKNRQDILRYKNLHSSSGEAEPPAPRTLPNNNQVQRLDQPSLKGTLKGCKTVVLPNYRNGGIGIGITVIPNRDGNVVVNRLLEGGPAIGTGLIQPRDQIVCVNGTRVTGVKMLSEVVQNSPDSVTLIIKPKSSKTSPVMEDPKRFLKLQETCRPSYINLTPYSDAKRIFEKGCTD